MTDFERVLMLQDTDPGVPDSAWWMTPGGGIDAGESELQAAVRELAEETGAVVEPSALAGPLLRRLVIHGYSDQVLAQQETFYLHQVPAPFELDTSGFTDDEKLTVGGWDWLPLAGLTDSGLPVWPADLPELIDLARRPDQWPVDRGVVEESTVDAGDLADQTVLDWAGDTPD